MGARFAPYAPAAVVPQRPHFRVIRVFRGAKIPEINHGTPGIHGSWEGRRQWRLIHKPRKAPSRLALSSATRNEHGAAEPRIARRRCIESTSAAVHEERSGSPASVFDKDVGEPSGVDEALGPVVELLRRSGNEAIADARR